MSRLLKHFGLRETPFSTTPDPAYAYATREHEAALARAALYLEDRKGLYLIRGDIGSGKTTVSYLAMQEWRSRPDEFLLAHITNPKVRTEAGFLRMILGSFGVEAPWKYVDLVAAFRGFLVEQYRSGKTLVLVIDEAQEMSLPNLDVLTDLANEQTSRAKLLQILLLGLPNITRKLDQRPALRSRIAGSSVLNPLTMEEAIDLIRHRISVAGGDFDAIFAPETHRMIYSATAGIPRNLCVLCDASLTEAFVAGRKRVKPEDIETALKAFDFKGWSGE